ncbi:MAG: hypothetical protein CVU89_14405 [Firmicutes bacterium HGW-Firmicutes-14]|nr:MAG: hypothetical protein CVU89_14405 [Firmicutes bacterium HGW-Firmicutes-14]
METYVVGTIARNTAESGRIRGVIDRLTPVGYEFTAGPDHYRFTKPGRIESVITEMVPVCEDHGLDVEAFRLVEYRKNNDTERSRYEGGKVVREDDGPLN